MVTCKKIYKEKIKCLNCLFLCASDAIGSGFPVSKRSKFVPSAKVPDGMRKKRLKRVEEASGENKRGFCPDHERHDHQPFFYKDYQCGKGFLSSFKGSMQ